MKIRIKGLSVAVLLGLALLASATANAKGKYDGSTNLLCAAFDVSACLESGVCSKGEARNFDLPEFFDVDFKKMVIHATYEAGAKEAESPIMLSEITGNQLILQGRENNHGWTMAINTETGRSTLSSVGYEVSFSIFGACKAQ